MKRLLAIILVLLATVASAQNDQTRNDRDFLTTLIEDNLSGAGRDIRIIGFAGALSSLATIEKLTIADDDGIWLVLNEVVLDWNRTALLKGRLEVNALTAAVIELPRYPVFEPAGVSPTAREFKFPELPVSVDIASIMAGRVVLGAPVLGRAVQVSLQGSLVLEGGSGRANLSILRTDQARGSLILDAEFRENIGDLMLDLSLSEEKDGIAAELLNLPGRPDVDLNIAGSGPVADFTADIKLATGGQDRLAGQVKLTQTQPDTAAELSEPVRQLQAQISGDIAPLFAPEYREFFGPHVALGFLAWRAPDGSLGLENLSLQASSLNLTGSGSIGENGWPDHFDLQATIRDTDGDAVLLPLTGPKTRVNSAELALAYDGSKGDRWITRLTTIGLEREGLTIEKLTLNGSGMINLAEAGVIGGVTGDFKFSATNIDPVDPSVARALGQHVSGKATLVWKQGTPVVFEGLDITGEDFGLSGMTTVSGLADNLEIDSNISIQAADFGRFAALAGVDLGGSGGMEIAGQYAPLGGAFDLKIAASTHDLKIGQAEIDKLLRKDGRLSIDIARDTSGTFLREFELVTQEIKATAFGRLGTQSGGLTVAARLTNLGVLVTGLNGPVTLDGTAKQHGDDWQLSVTGDGPAATRLALNGTVAGDGKRADLRATGTAQLALANPFIKPRSLSGDAQFNLSLQGPLKLSSVSGSIDARNGRLASPDLRLSATDMVIAASINGGQATVDLTGGISSGGRFTVTGPIALMPPNRASLAVDLQKVRLVDPLLYETVVGGSVAINGPLAGGARISGALSLSRTEITVPSSGVSEIGSLPGLTHINEPSNVRATRSRAGLLNTQNSKGSRGPGFGLDLIINAPERIFVRGRGLDAELGGQLRLGGSTNDIQPSGRFDLIRGRLDILGKRLDLTDGMVQMRGDFVPYIRFVATTLTDATRVIVTLEGKADNPTVTFSSQPELPGDEILSHMLFNRSITQISPFQAAQLASAVATLAGKGGVGIINKLRENFGLDDLDITTSDTGSTGLRVGKYISDNAYTDFEVDSDGTSQINLNLELSPSLVIKGGTGSDGNTSLGVFFEKDY